MPRKSVEVRQRHGERKLGQHTSPNGRLVHAEPPRNLLGVTVAAWEDFWQSPLAAFMQRTDLPALRRLFIMYDELERSRRALHSDPPPKPEKQEDEGHNDYQIRIGEWRVAVQSVGRLMRSTQGLKLNPLLTHMAGLETRIKELEDRFGLNLRARQELGLNELRALSLNEQNEQQEANGHHDEEEDDPVEALVAEEEARQSSADVRIARSHR